jgi:tetratricopeptide (TPR) repeat protein
MKNTNPHLTQIQNWIGNKFVFETISDKNKLDTIIQEIESLDGHVSIEILQFVNTFSLYKELDKKRKKIVEQLSKTNDYSERLKISEPLEEIENEEKQFIINVLNTAHSFTTLKYTGVLENVVESFFCGDIIIASQFLNEDTLTSNQDKHLQLIKEKLKLKEAYDKLEDNASEYKVKAQITILNFETEDPESRFQKSIFYFEKGKKSAEYTHRKNFYSGYLIEYANFLFKHNQFNRAEILYQENLQIKRSLTKENPFTYLPDIAITLDNLAKLHYTKNELVQAQDKYEEALEIKRVLAKENSHSFLSEVANILNNLAVLHYSKNEFGAAQGYYEEALKIRKSLAKEYPKMYLPDLATMLNNLAVLLQDIDEFDSALEKHEEALQIRRALAKENPQMYLYHLAMTLDNLANLLSTKNELGQAQDKYEEVLQIRRSLAKNNPRTYLPYVAGTLNNLANLQRTKNEYGLAQCNYEEALQIYRELTKENPQVYLPDVAGTLNNLANLYLDKNQFEPAQDSYEEALQIYRWLAEKNPKTFLPSVAMTTINLSIFYLNAIQNKEKSNSLAMETLKISFEFQENYMVQQYAKASIQVLQANGVNVEELIK